MTDRFERFSISISEISRYWHKLASEEMEKHGLRGPHSVYLLTMQSYPDGITAPQLCELCGKDKSDVSFDRRGQDCQKAVRGVVGRRGISRRDPRGVHHARA